LQYDLGAKERSPVLLLVFYGIRDILTGPVDIIYRTVTSELRGGTQTGCPKALKIETRFLCP